MGFFNVYVSWGYESVLSVALLVSHFVSSGALVATKFIIRISMLKIEGDNQVSTMAYTLKGEEYTKEKKGQSLLARLLEFHILSQLQWIVIGL